MNLSSNRMKWIIGGIAALMLIIGTLLVWSTTSAAQPTPAAAGPARSMEDRALANVDVGGRMGGGQYRDLYQAQLASELGITVDELQTAQQAAQEAVVQQLADDGTITQEQADLMIAKAQLKDYIDHDALQAEALGITVDELQAARDDGQTLDELLDEQGLDRDTYRENLAAARDAAIDQAVADGIITAEQAEQLQDNWSFGPGDRPGRGPRNPGGRGF